MCIKITIRQPLIKIIYRSTQREKDALSYSSLLFAIAKTSFVQDKVRMREEDIEMLFLLNKSDPIS